MAAHTDIDLLKKLQQLVSENPIAFSAAAVAGVAAVTFLMSGRSSVRPLSIPFDLSDQSVVINGQVAQSLLFRSVFQMHFCFISLIYIIVMMIITAFVVGNRRVRERNSTVSHELKQAFSSIR